MESFFVLMSELTVLGGGKDGTRQTIIRTGWTLLNAAAQVQHKQKHRYSMIMVRGSWESFGEEAVCDTGLKGMGEFSCGNSGSSFGPNRLSWEAFTFFIFYFLLLSSLLCHLPTNPTLGLFSWKQPWLRYNTYKREVLFIKGENP